MPQLLLPSSNQASFRVPCSDGHDHWGTVQSYMDRSVLALLVQFFFPCQLGAVHRYVSRYNISDVGTSGSPAFFLVLNLIIASLHVRGIVVVVRIPEHGRLIIDARAQCNY